MVVMMSMIVMIMIMRVVMVAVIRMVMIVRMPVGMGMPVIPPGRATPQKPEADSRHKNSADDRKYRVDSIHGYVGRRIQGDQAKNKDASGMSDCNDCTQVDCIRYAAAGAGKICCNYRLAVTGRKRVSGPEYERHAKRAGQHERIAGSRKERFELTRSHSELRNVCLRPSSNSTLERGPPRQ